VKIFIHAGGDWAAMWGHRL